MLRLDDMCGNFINMCSWFYLLLYYRDRRECWRYCKTCHRWYDYPDNRWVL